MRGQSGVSQTAPRIEGVRRGADPRSSGPYAIAGLGRLNSVAFMVQDCTQQKSLRESITEELHDLSVRLYSWLTVCNCPTLLDRTPAYLLDFALEITSHLSSPCAYHRPLRTTNSTSSTGILSLRTSAAIAY